MPTLRRIKLLALVLLLAAPAAAQQPPSVPLRRPPIPRPGRTIPRKPAVPARAAQADAEAEREKEAERAREEERRDRAQEGRTVAQARTPAEPATERVQARRKAFNQEDVPVRLDFDRVDIVEMIKTISDITGRNFILPDNIRGKITILSPTPVTPDQAYAAFLAALEANNLTVYQVGKFLKIVPKKDGVRSSIPTVTDVGGRYPWNEQLVTKVFHLEYAEVDQVSGIVKALISRDGDVQTVGSDLLIITEVGLNLHRIEKIIEQINQAGSVDEIRIIQVRYASAPDLAQKLMEIFEGSQTPAPAARRTVRGRQVARPGQPQQNGGELEVTVSRIIADERTNKLIVIADQTSFKRIREILAQLDVPTEGEGQVHVHYLSNANSEELASTLSQLATGGASAGARRTPRPAQGGAAAGASAELFEGELKISADKGTNSLVIVSSYNDYKQLKKVIEKLDIPRRQVFVEAVIMEVSLDTSDEFGLAFHQGAAPEIGANGEAAPILLGTQLGGLNSLSLSGLLQFGGFLSGIQGPPVPGTAELGVSIPSFGVVLQALQRDSHVNVLSTPHILTSDNEEAEITVGQNVPFQAGFTPPGLGNLLGNTTQTNQANTGLNAASLLGGFGGLSGGLSSLYAPIQRQNVELRLKIKPQINESDQVRLAIEEQTEEIASTDRVLGPTTAKRTAKTTVVASDGMTVVIGGLVQERNVESVSKVPFFGDIPIFGHLFRSTENKTIKTNLLLFLTPYIIKSPQDFRRIFERKLAERQTFVEQFYGIAGDYRPALDYGRKIGPLGTIQKTLHEELMAPENGGAGLNEQVITPTEDPAPIPFKPLGGSQDDGEGAGDPGIQMMPEPPEPMQVDPEE